MKKPIIGIVSKHDDIDFIDWTICSISDHLRVSLLQNGAIPLGILPTKHNREISDSDIASTFINPQEKEDLIAVLKVCDGVVLQGGLSSEEYELFCGKWCKENNVPILGICSGFNNLILACAGRCEEDLESAKVHNLCKNEPSHEIDIVKNSLLHKITKKQKLFVNSLHTYFAKETGSARVIASHQDGTIEAVQLDGHPFFLGVKFHPELLLDDKDMQSIINAFVKASIKANKKFTKA